MPAVSPTQDETDLRLALRQVHISGDQITSGDIPEIELRALFGELQNAGNQITDGEKLYDLVSSSLSSTGAIVAKAAELTVWLLKGWNQIWAILKEGVDRIINWIKSAWNGLKSVLINFWDWLKSLF